MWYACWPSVKLGGFFQTTFSLSLNIYIYIYIGLVVECSPMVRESRVQSQVESYQRLKTMVTDASLLITKVWIKGKVEQSRESCLTKAEEPCVTAN